ncbi:MAG: spore germination protein [Clostridia bacterium]|nr:spore germination protein [Clostridia bacterium]
MPSEDILTYNFTTADGTACAIVYTDGVVNKQLLGDLVARPFSKERLPKESAEKLQSFLEKTLLFPELKSAENFQKAQTEILDGNSLLLVDGVPQGFIVGAKLLPNRAVVEPPTDVTVKGPREGFIEDIKTNMALIRKRLKTPHLRFETVRVGKQSNTAVSLCYLNGIVDEKVKNSIKKQLNGIQIDNVPDSSYISALLSPRKHSLFRTVGTTEKPDVFTAKLCEGRVGILVDGSPIALTVPYLLTEDLQSSEDYFISPFAATAFRFLRCIALFIAILLPGFYVAAQVYKIQLLPLGLTLTIASSIRELPLSPNLEMFVVLLLLEILKEASIRMPKYVGMSLSVVGALVLGETAVSAGFLSTPAIIVVALSGICLYTVPNFVETGSLLRWLFLLVAGSIGIFGIVLLSAFLLCYLISSDAFGAPILAPFSPLVPRDLRDTVVKYDIFSLAKRPKLFQSKNQTRLLPLGTKPEKTEADSKQK